MIDALLGNISALAGALGAIGVFLFVLGLIERRTWPKPQPRPRGRG